MAGIKNNKLFTIIWLGLLTGTLDGLAAVLTHWSLGAAVIFKFIASGAFGKAAFDGGARMILWGVFFHYLIAFSFSAVFFLAYPRVKSILKNVCIIIPIYAIITWVITNLIIIPLSQIGWEAPKMTSVLKEIGILVITIG